MTKIAGAIILLCAAVGYGFVKIREERRRIAEAEALAELVKYIRDNILHYMKPLPEIFASYASPLLEENGFLPDCREKGIGAAWERAVFHLPDKLNRTMTDFAYSVGGGYREDELSLCGYTLDVIGEAVKTMRNEQDGKEKLYRTIPPLLALSVMLIFL